MWAQPNRRHGWRSPRRRGLLAALLLGLLAGACATAPKEEPPAPAAAPSEPDPSVYRRADADRLKLLEHEIERLRADLRAAEETLVAVESGLRGAQTRAEVGLASPRRASRWTAPRSARPGAPRR